MTVDERELKKQEEAGERAEDVIDLQPVTLNPDLYFNREQSLLGFHARVLDEALDERNQMLERLRFLAIFNSNLDEFFMIRVSGIREQVIAGTGEPGPDGMTPSQILASLRARTLPLLHTQSAFYRDKLCPALRRQGITIANYSELTPEQKKAAQEYFERMVFPVCTPLAVDPGHPFPHISNLSLNLAVELQEPSGQTRFARLKVPNVLPRFVPLPSAPTKEQDKDGGRPRYQPVTFVWLEQVLTAHVSALFPQMKLLQVHPFRVIRDADLEIQELEADDLLETIEESVARRRFGSTVALFVNPGMPKHICDLLVDNLQLTDNDVYTTDGHLGLADLLELYKLDRPDLKDPPFTPYVPPLIRNSSDVIHAMQQSDILLHHPFDSFTPVIDLIRAAAADPDVLAIKQTLYRVGNHSPIVEALLEAAQAGKQVAVLVELKARGDEENNIEWARALEQMGVHVTYGLIGLKTHCKVALVVRKEGDGIRRYMHLGTGNYNPSTARGYTDLGLLTCNPDIGADVTELFNYLTGYSKQTQYRKLLVAPVTMRAGIIALIEREIKKHRESGDGRIIIKVNHLVDPACIEALYRASRAGVRVDLIVRGMCSLRPGVPRISDNITVTRVVGRFLEHSRVLYFRNGGKEEMFMGSADLMQRNLDRRVEAMFPIEDEAIRRYVRDDILEAYLRDNTKASVLQRDGRYVRRQPTKGEPPFNVQQSLIKQPSGDGEIVVSLSDLPKRYRKHLSGYGRERERYGSS